MMSLKKIVRCLSFCFFMLSTTTVSGDDAFHSHDAHQHGYGELGIALENEELSISGRFPASDIVGFEHRARSADELKAVSNLEEAFSEANNLFVFPPSAHCTQKEQTLEHSLRGESHGEDEGNHEHHDTHVHASHSEIRAEYRFHCKNSDQLKHIEVELFKRFPSLHKIEALIVTSSYQGKQELTSSSSLLRISE